MWLLSFELLFRVAKLSFEFSCADYLLLCAPCQLQFCVQTMHKRVESLGVLSAEILFADYVQAR